MHRDLSSMGTEEFKGWAEETATSLRELASKGENADAEAIGNFSRDVASMLISKLDPSTYTPMVHDIWQKMLAINEECVELLIEDSPLQGEWGDEEPKDVSREMFEGNKDEEDFESDVEEEERENLEKASALLEEVIVKQLPTEMVEFLAKQIFSNIVEDLKHEETALSPIAHNNPKIAWEERPVINPQLAWEVENLAGVPTTLDTSSRYSGFSSSDPSAKSESSDQAEESNNKETKAKKLAALQLASFKKFKLVCVSARGLRVKKHNHRGGKKERILRYNLKENKIVWDSSKIMGRDNVKVADIVTLKRTENILYIWHGKIKKNGTRKAEQMVGFETQREADAKIIEKALEHLILEVQPPKKSPLLGMTR
ncbi:unnamed protein product [Chrysoparadoxa australica]